jgi:hypothetical protein
MGVSAATASIELTVNLFEQLIPRTQSASIASEVRCEALFLACDIRSTEEVKYRAFYKDCRRSHKAGKLCLVQLARVERKINSL